LQYKNQAIGPRLVPFQTNLPFTRYLQYIPSTCIWVSKWPRLFRTYDYQFTSISRLSHMCYMSRSFQLPWFNHANNISHRLKIMKLLPNHISKCQIEFYSPEPDPILHHYELNTFIRLRTYSLVGLKLRFKEISWFFFSLFISYFYKLTLAHPPFFPSIFLKTFYPSFITNQCIPILIFLPSSVRPA
jgi:hypothetical protein